MKKHKIARMYLVLILTMFVMMSFGVVTTLADESVNWNSNTQNSQLNAPEGKGSDQYYPGWKWCLGA